MSAPPPPLPAAYAPAWRRLVADLEADAEVLGATVSGSVLRGEGGPTSDLDVYVLIRGSERWRRTYVLEGVLIEEFRNPEPWIRRYLEALDDVPGIHMLGHGVVVLDRSPVFASLCAQARAAYQAGPPPLSAADATWARYAVWDGWCDVRDLLAAGGDPARALGLLQSQAWSALQAFLRLSGRWPAKGKRLLEALGDLDPALAADAAALWRGPWSAAAPAFAVYDRIVRRVLEPHDPDRPLVWESARQPLP